MLNKLESQHNVNEMLGQLSSMNPFIFAAAAINQSNNVGGGGNLLQQLTSQSNDITKITTPFGNGLVSPPKQPSNQSTPGTGTSQQQQTFTSSTSQGHQVNGICQQQSSSSNNNTTTSTPSGSTNFTLSDNFCIQSLISIAKDMNIALTYTSDSTNIDEFTLSCKGPLNTPNFLKKSVVLKDFPDEIKIYERTGDMLSESEAWRKTEWSQMQWALRGKVQNILFK
ncbi:Hypothetical protein SRAE_2000044100 [Strongyloides ratti]|uniref:Uncharacterized protein n=1 Tax=Strongyloides ratti TaxID=34506 RepID=A0A090LE55_STRRB|nr:Hypothetical protein SRAE_2000044100 [Strongyloides ratti]CEF65765.1 Hypothetical protein SRAE_2000044100 [Strongyloides ratti]